MSDSPPDANDIRALLEDGPYIDDAGFSARVAGSLPRGRRVKIFSFAAVPLFATLACALALTLSGPGHARQGAHHGFSLEAMMPFLALAFALLLVASATLLPADE